MVLKIDFEPQHLSRKASVVPFCLKRGRRGDNSIVQLTPVILGIFFAACCGVAVAAPKKPDVARVEALVIEGTNEFRASQSRGPVKRNRTLEQSAREFAQYMARTGKFDHDADGSTPAARATRHGYDYCHVAENISRQYSTAGFSTAELARELVEGWKNSPGHRKNMLEAEVLDTAVAVAHRSHNGYQDYYAVQLFARPRSSCIARKNQGQTTIIR